MPRQLTRLLMTAVVITTMAATLLPAPASADPIPPRPCSGSSCNGSFPDNGCGQGDYYNPLWSSPVFKTFKEPGGQIGLYYSPWCNANWAVIGDGPSPQVIWVENANGVREGAADNPFASALVDGSVGARACAEFGFAGSASIQVCTPWFLGTGAPVPQFSGPAASDYGGVLRVFAPGSEWTLYQ
ncbi:MAG TPA: hypothetical protein VF486_17790, partial [Actinomycetes bacterium]